MKTLFEGIEAILGTIAEVKYFSENWGQLDAMHYPKFPVKFPCVLYDVQSGEFENIGRDRSADPISRQQGAIQIVIDVADMLLGNTSGYAPAQQKQNARFIWSVHEKLHEAIHGQVVAEGFGKLIRKRMMKIEREDGVRQHRLIYTTTWHHC